MRHYGTGETVRFTGSSHDERAFITKSPAAVGALNRHLAAKIDDHRAEIEMAAADLDPGGRHPRSCPTGSPPGPSGRRCAGPGRPADAVSSLVLQSLWPVPENALRAAAAGVRRVLVPELNLGQYRLEVERLLPGARGAGPQPGGR